MLRSFGRPLALAALFALALAPQVDAAATPEADKVIRRYVDATGGPAAFAAEGSLYTRARLTGFGFSGSLETWSVRPDKHYARTELGPFKLSEGSDGRTAWRTDPTTGRVVTLTDQDLAESLASTWYELERWAEADGGGGTITVTGHEKDAKGTYTVLTMVPPGGGTLKPRRYWFSDATGLLARIEAPRDQNQIATDFSDWRRAAGRLRAFVNESGISNMPANRMTSTADSFAVNVRTEGLAFQAPLPEGVSTVRWRGASGALKLPFDYAARHVWLRASVNGAPPADFLFDTGATISVLDSTYAASIGLKGEGFMQAQGAGAAGSASFVTLDSIAVHGPGGSGVSIAHPKLAIMSVAPAFGAYFWHDLAGVLGYDFISRFVVTIDYDHAVLELHDPATYAYAGKEQPLPMVMNGVVPGVTATIDGTYTGVFRMDVGSSSTVDIHGPFASKHGLEDKLVGARDVEGVGFGGHFTTRYGRLSRMAIGPYAWDAPMVSVARAAEGAFASEEFAGNIGNRVLERFTVTLDYDHRRIWLEPGERFASRDALSRSGMLVGRAGGKVVALSVLPGSPAHAAGIRDDDELVSVQGKPAGEWTLSALDAVLEQGEIGSRVKIEVLRDGKKKSKHTVTLREMLP